MKKILVSLVLGFAIIAPQVAKAMDPLSIMGMIGCCCTCCAKTMPLIIKFGQSVMHERDVKALKDKLIVLQKKHEKVFTALVKKCLDQKIVIQDPAVKQMLLMYGFILPSGALADCVQDAVFALVIDQDERPLSVFTPGSVSDDSGRSASTVLSGSHKILKQPHQVDAKNLKIISRKESLKRGLMSEATYEESLSFHTCRSHWSTATGSSSGPGERRAVHNGEPFVDHPLYDPERR